MYNGIPGPPPGGMMSSMGMPQQQSAQKHDIFVGNLAFNTTEEQLHQAFSDIGRVLKVRLVTDIETGKPRGFAFIEFEDPQAALSAIRNMNDYELNGRRLRVNFSNSSHLEALAGKLGMDLPQQTKRTTTQSSAKNQTSGGTDAIAAALKGMSKGEMYSIVAKFKEIADGEPDEARRILSGHPQLPEAMLYLMSTLGMVQTPVVTDGGTAGLAPPPLPGGALPMPPSGRAADPRARASDPRAAAPVDPRSAAVVPPPPRADPRARIDPRASRSVPPAPPMPPQPPQYGVPPPPPPSAGVANLDPALVQQVMSLTPQQISQLPPNKQQSILALRQQISGGR
ncbi:unnamed protein product [Cylindrotheca closterium]|uniref:RRM domain-containing protein n=1 Tax=Cylindrotheca closterium TaxID=2856 RepID=A0AAD2CAX3_9STRA|nr:unnamed protein product [Cylindrotheca closterium]